MDEILALTLGMTAAIAFPVIALMVHRSRDRRHNRRMGRRRTDKIQL